MRLFGPKNIRGGISSRYSYEEAATVSSANGSSTSVSSKHHGHWSESIQAILEHPPSSLSGYLIAAGLVFTCTIGIWSWFGKVEEISSARGQLVPEGEVYKVQPVVAGEIAKILAEEGDAVQAGQIIVTLDQRILNKELERLQASLVAYQLQLSQTQALISKTRLELSAQKSISAAEIASKQSAISQVRSEADTNQQVLDYLLEDVRAYEARVERLSELVEQGGFAEDQLFQIEQSLRDRQRAVTESEGEVTQHTEQISQLKAELAAIEANAQKREIEANKSLQQLEIQASELRAKITETQALLDRTQAELEQTQLIAPVNGVVSSLAIANTGEVVQPSQTIAEIAPTETPLILTAMLPDREAGLVEEGMLVKLKFDAFPFQEYGMVTGEVTSISPDSKAIAPPTGNNSEQISVYIIKISLDRHYFKHEGERVELKAGQKATAEIVVRQRRIISLVLDPIRKLKEGGVNL